MALQRYEQDELVTSTQNGFSDLLDWLQFLHAKEYLLAVLQGVHGLSNADALKRCAKIVPHVRVAAAYVRQSLDGPAEISFLPAYYAILNLMKVYVLLGHRHADLSRNRLHGATYDPQGKDSRSILTEEIVLKDGGVFPLFYETVCGKRLPKRNLSLRVGDFLGCVSGTTFEYSLATGRPHAVCQLGFHVAVDQGVPRVVSQIAYPPAGAPKGRAQALAGFTTNGNAAPVYIGPPVPSANGPVDLTTILRGCIKTHLLYRLEPSHTYSIVTNSGVEFPQELPVALLFFYMSSVVRYRPEYFARLRDSKFWPVISCARAHAFLEFLLCFWSFVHRKNYFINAPIYMPPIAGTDVPWLGIRQPPSVGVVSRLPRGQVSGPAKAPDVGDDVISPSHVGSASAAIPDVGATAAPAGSKST